MSINEFHTIYKEELMSFIDETILELEQFKKLPFNQFRQKYLDLQQGFTIKTNILVSEILSKNNINLDLPVLQNYNVVDINSYLYLSCFSIILECREHFYDKIDTIFEEVLHQVLPQKD
ncbi:hypothetical protein ACSLMH_01095 [Flavobacterium columnare]|uniref:hypothetical protein n=1 Tax=Flavobacterium columnare TaxID=996 RepID=UPI0040342D41